MKEQKYKGFLKFFAAVACTLAFAAFGAFSGDYNLNVEASVSDNSLQQRQERQDAAYQASVAWINADTFGSSANAGYAWNQALTRLTATLAADTGNTNQYVVTGRNIKVPENVFSALQGSPGTMILSTGTGVDFSLTGANVPANVDGKTLDLSLKTGNISAPAAMVAELSKDATMVKHYPMNSNAEFGMTVGLHVFVKAANAGNFANLYCYEDGKMILVGSYEVNEKGQAMFGITKACQYVMTVTKNPAN
jgi:hypothetical protein